MKCAAFLRLPLLALGFLLGSCSSPSPANNITVGVAAFHATGDGATITLVYANESVYALGISSASHKLYLDGRLVADLPSTPPIGVPPLKSTHQDVPVQFKDADYVRRLAGSPSAVAVHYRLESTLFEKVAEEDFKGRSSSEGTLDLRPLGPK